MPSIWGDLPAAVRLYIVDTVFYSAIVALVAEVLFRLWRVNHPSFRFKFRLLVLFLPVAAWAFYYIIAPGRNGDLFRVTRALLDLNAWLGISVGGFIPLPYAFLLLLFASTVLFAIQEVLLAVYHLLPKGKMRRLRAGEYPGLQEAIAEVAGRARHPLPHVLVIDRLEPVIYTLGSIRPSVVVSRQLIAILDRDELRGVLAHEMGHVVRQERWWSWLLLLARALMFFNPVALLVFRKLAQDNEQICDDMAIAITGQPLALASGLIKVFRNENMAGDAGRQRRAGLGLDLSAVQGLYDHSHRTIVQKRVERLVHPPGGGIVAYGNFRLAAVSIMLLELMFFVV